jgi:hypothetical protein
MTDGVLFEKLTVLNNVYNNTLIPGKGIQQASVIKTQLLPHQNIMVNAMHIHRDKMIRGFLVGNQAVNGKIGIVGDPAGTGKTLTVLSYLTTQISTYPRITCELSDNSNKYFFSHDVYQLTDSSSANLIIVPHSLFNHWKQEIQKHTTINYTPIETRRIIKGNDLANSMVNTSFVLTTNRCYKYVQEYANQYGIQWNNVFIDEASSIYINSSDPVLKFQFIWLITNNWLPLLFKNPAIVKNNLYYLKDRVNLNPELEQWLLDNTDIHYESNLVSSSYLKEYLPFFHQNRGYLVLRNNINYINSILKLPNTINQQIQCRPNITLNSLISYYLARNIEPNINPDKILHLYQALNVEFKSIDEYVSYQPSHKHDLIKRKFNEGECVICLEQIENPTITNCCYNVYCGKCLLKNTIINHKCPMCRETLSIDKICCLKQLSEQELVLNRNKSEMLIDLLENNRSGKFIIYSAFENIYYQLFDDIDRLGLKAERIENNLFSQLKTIKNYQDGPTNILFVSNIDLIRGISLAITSHLIFFHELPVYESKQILIHSAQRIGRSQPLKIIHLNSEIQV